MGRARISQTDFLRLSISAINGHDRGAKCCPGFEVPRYAEGGISRARRQMDETFGRGLPVETAGRTIIRGRGTAGQPGEAFVLEPEFLLLDEPFAALDPPTRSKLLEDLSALLNEDHRTAVFVTHNLN